MSPDLQRSPLFEHDCDKCIYLGTYDNHDLYFCGRGDNPDTRRIDSTVIARYSSYCSDYQSGIPFGEIPLTHPHASRHLRVAFLIAQDLGLIAKG